MGQQMGVHTDVTIGGQCTTFILHSPDDDQSILIETSSCNLQFFSELITTQLIIIIIIIIISTGTENLEKLNERLLEIQRIGEGLG